MLQYIACFLPQSKICRIKKSLILFWSLKLFLFAFLDPCPEGKVYDACAFRCDQMCSFLANKLSDECQSAPDGCIPGCRPAEDCEPPNLWRDYYTCVSKENCICVMQDENGTTISVPVSIFLKNYLIMVNYLISNMFFKILLSIKYLSEFLLYNAILLYKLIFFHSLPL